MDKRRHIKISKFLSYVLRHHPDSFGIKLDGGGRADIEKLIQKADRKGMRLKHDEIRTVVKENDKQRFSLSEDGLKIRANYGHSISVNLGYSPVEPPDVLYHGTSARDLKAICTNGLTKGNLRLFELWSGALLVFATISPLKLLKLEHRSSQDAL